MNKDDLCHADTEQAEVAVSQQAALQSGSDREAIEKLFKSKRRMSSPVEDEHGCRLVGFVVHESDYEHMFDSMEALNCLVAEWKEASTQAGLKSEATPSSPQADSQHDTNEISRLKAVRSAVWDEAVEECAKKLASLKHEYEMNEDTAPAPDVSLWSGAIHAVEAMENALRSLKHGCHERPEPADSQGSEQALPGDQSGNDREAE